jgi:hypothetical protein
MLYLGCNQVVNQVSSYGWSQAIKAFPIPPRDLQQTVAEKILIE